jgi:hypothetical protein
MSSPSSTKDQEATLVSTQDDLEGTALALDALRQEGQPPPRAAAALPVDSPESGSSQSVGTTFVPEADEPIMSAAFVSMQDRQSRLTSLLHHLTVDPEAPDQELPIAGLPAVERSRNAGVVTRRARTGWQFARLFVVTGVTTALIGWGMVLLPGARKAGTETVQAESPPPPVATRVQSATEVPPLIHDSLPQEGAEPSGAANAATEAPPLIHDSLPQKNTEPSGAANAATGVPPLVHDSLPQENTEPSGAANAATGVPPLVHDSLPQEKTELSGAANVQPATEVPPRVHDSRAHDDIPPLPAAETSRDQAPKPQLPQSVGSSQVLDAGEIAALVKRGKDFANHGDLISARLLLRRAAEAGSAEAALALGETFDPVVFQRLHVIGIEPDAARAQKWYQRAAELGSAAASQHFAKPDREP